MEEIRGLFEGSSADSANKGDFCQAWLVLEASIDEISINA